MAEVETGWRWWLRYIIVPIVATGGVVGVIVSAFFIKRDDMNPTLFRMSHKDDAQSKTSITTTPEPIRPSRDSSATPSGRSESPATDFPSADWDESFEAPELPPDPSASNGVPNWVPGFYYYRVVNDTDVTVNFRTVDAKGHWLRVSLPSRTSKTFGWDSPNNAIVDLVSINGRKATGRWKAETYYAKHAIESESPEARAFPSYRFQRIANDKVVLLGRVIELDTSLTD